MCIQFYSTITKMDKLYINDENIIYTDALPYVAEPGGLGKLFFTRMASYNDAIAQVDGYTGEPDTYSALLQRCVRTAITMRTKGLSEGDIISICTYNHFNSAVPFIAGLFIGVISANLDPDLPLEDTVLLIKQVKPKLIFAGPESVKFIENSLKDSAIHAEIVVFGKSVTHTEFSSFIEFSAEEEHFTPIEVDLKTTAVICFSSGTTGFPKGICLPHLSVQLQAMRARDIGYDLHGFLGFSTMYWSTAIYIACSCIIHKGYKVVVPTFNLTSIWRTLSKVKVSSMIIPAYYANLMFQKGRPLGIRINLKYYSVNGSYVGTQLQSDLRTVLPEANYIPAYALTEEFGYCICFKPHCIIDSDLFKKKPGSSGRPLSGFTMKVVDPDTAKILGPFEHGELLIKSNLHMNGYYNVDSSSAWDAYGWLRTGDIVYYDRDRCFYIVDRVKEIMRVKSTTVLPVFIEEVLRTCRGVKMAVVVGIPHATDGEHPVGIVTLDPELINKPSAEEIAKYVEDRVDDTKRLRGGVKIVDSIPLTPSSKVNRRLIKKMIIEGHI